MSRTDVLLDAVSECPTRWRTEVETLGVVLVKVLKNARLAWPTLCVPDLVFVRWIAVRLDRSKDSALQAVDALRTDELYLACACAIGLPDAAPVFTSRYERLLRGVVQKLGVTSTDVDDVLQETFARVLVGTPPRIATFQGRSRLEQWLGVVAARVAAGQQRKGPAKTERLALELRAVARAGPRPDEDARDIVLLRDAITAALNGLDTTDRLLLLQHYADRITLHRLSVMHGAHPATISRRLRRARQRVVSATHRALRDRGIAIGEHASLLEAIDARLDLSLSRLRVVAASR